MSLSELLTIARVFPYKFRRQRLCMGKITQHQRRSRVIKKQRRGIGFQSQSFIE